MRKTTLFFIIILVIAGGGLAASQNSRNAALTGVVKSDAEGPMEGVLVSAKLSGGTITVTVISDTKGRYAFPAGSLKPGKYNLAIRAVGYDAPASGLVASVGDKQRNSTSSLARPKILLLNSVLLNG